MCAPSAYGSRHPVAAGISAGGLPQVRAAATAALCDSYYPAAWASGTPIEQPEQIRGGVYALIEDPEGPIRRQIARSVDDLIARMPTHEEAVELGLPPGVPVVRVLRTVFDSADLPVEVQDSVIAADRHEFRYEEQMR